MKLFPSINPPKIRIEGSYNLFIVICGNMREFDRFCHEMNKKKDKIYNVEYLYYTNTKSIRGIRPNGIIKWGTWYMRNDVDWNYLKILTRI